MKYVFLFMIAAASGFAASSGGAADVHLERVPNGGIQPRVAAGANGTIHLIYYSGDPMAGDIYYVRSSDGGVNFSEPLRVNSHPGSAIAAGNIRGASIAVGRNGRVHVAWNGSKNAEPKGPNGATPMLYTRMNDAGGAFEPERDVIQSSYGLDGGGAVAADQGGNVYVFWHAPTPGTTGEGNRRIWVVRSSDDGKTFSRETAASGPPTGACGCCGMAAVANPAGDLFALYRSATDTVNRDMYLLSSHDHGRTFADQKIDDWKIGSCVMSSAAFSATSKRTYAAWETQGQIHFGEVTAKMASALTAVPGEPGKRKHPGLAVSQDGRVVVAWTEGMGWKKGGSLAWQVYDSKLRPVGETGHADGVPAWSLLAVFARPDGGFTVLY